MTDISSLIQRNRAGEPIGLPCFCTANEQVLSAVFKYAGKHNLTAVIEATCNQVNQDGGYTGMTASDFSQWVEQLAGSHGVASDHVILGGDHLGPNPWRHLPAGQAMQNAEVLVKDYAAAGFCKIHLDASMACGGEATPSFKLVAARAAKLCKIAEQYSPHPERLFYIIGTEVPVPGGETDAMDDLAVTSVARFNETIETHQEAFEREGLQHVWPKIVSVVTQPGVDFSHEAVHRFEPHKAIDLTAALQDGAHNDSSTLTFEAHSTDYQPTDALAQLVAGHFFFLKVGPELTFRMREAVFALAKIEQHLIPAAASSLLIETIDRAMDNDNQHWTAYYRGEEKRVKQLRHFSYSDRIRYYWAVPEVKAALAKLLSNLDRQPIPETIVSQYFPQRAFGTLNTTAEQLTSDHIALCIERYYRACGQHTTAACS